MNSLPPEPDHNPQLSAEALAELVERLSAAEHHLAQVSNGQTETVVAASSEQAFLLAKAQMALTEQSAFQRAIFDALPANVAVIDGDGNIILVNAAWRQFAVENGLSPVQTEIGKNYIEICEQVRGENEGQAKAAAEGIRCLLAGRSNEFSFKYECHSPDKKRWFNLIGKPVPCRGRLGAVILHFDITAQKLAEEARRESEDRFQLVARATNEAVWDWNMETNYLWWSVGFQNLFGYAEDEIECNIEAWRRLIHPEDRNRVWAGFSKAIETSLSVWQDEYRFCKKEGSYAVVFDRGHIVRNREGRAIRMIGGMRDITEQKQAELRIRESEEQFRQMAENIDDIFWIRDLKSNQLLYVSPAFEKITGRSRETVRGDDLEYFLAVAHPEDHPRIREAVKHSNAGCSLEYRVLRPDGGVRWFWGKIFPICDEQGVPFRSVGVSRDITERKAVEAKMKEQAALLDKARDVIVVCDMDARILYWNKSAENLYGWTQREVLGKGVTDLLYSDAESYNKTSEKILEAGEWKGELTQITKSGKEVFVEGTWTLLRDDMAKPRGILAIQTDITDKKRMETQLLRSQRLESLGVLAGGIAHDLNNVLAPVLMAVGLLKIDAADAITRSTLETIEGSAKRGAEMVKQILSFARGVDGKRIALQVEHVAHDLRKIVEETFPKSIRVEFGIQPNLPPVFADPTQLHQVLLNLCVNARDAMPTGGTITIRADVATKGANATLLPPEAKRNIYVHVSVSDTGSGIPPEIQEKIFDPFFTTKEQGKGTGLGLSTVLGIVKSHHGYIDFESEIGRGTTFHVLLPATEAPRSVVARPEASSLPRGQGELVLIVDDEESIRTITRHTLEEHGYKTICAKDGADALIQYRSHKDSVAVVIMDMMMPVMDGPATIHSLCRVNSDVKIIAVTGLPTGEKIHGAHSSAVSRFLPKPYTARTLLTALHEVIQGGKQ